MTNATTSRDDGIAFGDLMAQLKVCGTCHALVLTASVDEHKQWHLDQIELLKDYVAARMGS